jgi:hypothetical protein
VIEAQGTALSQRRRVAESCFRHVRSHSKKGLWETTTTCPSRASAPLRLCGKAVRCSSCASARFAFRSLARMPHTLVHRREPGARGKRTTLSRRRRGAEACFRQARSHSKEELLETATTCPSRASAPPRLRDKVFAVPRVPPRASRSDVWLSSLTRSRTGESLGCAEVLEANELLCRRGAEARRGQSPLRGPFSFLLGKAQTRLRDSRNRNPQFWRCRGQADSAISSGQRQGPGASLPSPDLSTPTHVGVVTRSGWATCACAFVVKRLR